MKLKNTIYMDTSNGTVYRYSTPKKTVYGEWVISCYVNGKRDANKTIYENTVESAIATMESDCKGFFKMF